MDALWRAPANAPQDYLTFERAEDNEPELGCRRSMSVPSFVYTRSLRRRRFTVHVGGSGPMTNETL